MNCDWKCSGKKWKIEKRKNCSFFYLFCVWWVENQVWWISWKLGKKVDFFIGNTNIRFFFYFYVFIAFVSVLVKGECKFFILLGFWGFRGIIGWKSIGNHREIQDNRTRKQRPKFRDFSSDFPRYCYFSKSILFFSSSYWCNFCNSIFYLCGNPSISFPLTGFCIIQLFIEIPWFWGIFREFFSFFFCFGFVKVGGN